MSHPNELMLADYVKAWSEHNVEKILNYFTDDCVYEDTTLGVVKHGKPGIIEFAGEIFEMQPDFHLAYDSHFATETDAAAQWTITNTWNGEFGGIDVTGKKVKFSGLSVLQLRDGKISRNLDVWDLTPLLIQLGVLTEELRKCK